jgi:hypothetical protein
VVQFIGDVDGSHTGDAGEVTLSQFLTNDTTAASGTTGIDFNSRGNISFDSISFVAGGNTPIASNAGVANCANVTFKRCFFFSLTSAVLTLTCVTNTNMGWLFEKCIFTNVATVLSLTCPTSTSADYTMGFTVRNCLFLIGSAANGISFNGSGAGSFKPGGASIYNNTFIGGTGVIRVPTAGAFSTTIPITVYNCVFLGSNAASLNVATSGQVVEDYNYFIATSPRTNVTAGANSKAGNVLYPGVHLGQECSTALSAGLLPCRPSPPRSWDLVNRPA